MDDTLQDLRISLDNIDNAMVLLLAERFRVTQKVGQLKRDQGLPPQDASREASRFAHMQKLAVEAGLNPELVQSLWRKIMDEVIDNHKALQKKELTK
jgi:chorismate mutase